MLDKAQHEKVQEFRKTLGQFPTGVAVVTALASDGQPVGMTINSFNSVSLTPALISWCIDRDAASFTSFMLADRFAISVLAADQAGLAIRFATKGADKFHDITLSADGAPFIPGASAWFRCNNYWSTDLGDHALIIGRVIEFSSSEAVPLVFSNGRFRQLSMIADPLDRAA
jgi:flavin reductase (DIM6/NTAB) family NADH-FMN oxidoreductase RutF